MNDPVRHDPDDEVLVATSPEIHIKINQCLKNSLDCIELKTAEDVLELIRQNRGSFEINGQRYNFVESKHGYFNFDLPKLSSTETPGT
jgi:hypothetical protein